MYTNCENVGHINLGLQYKDTSFKTGIFRNIAQTRNR